MPFVARPHRHAASRNRHDLPVSPPASIEGIHELWQCGSCGRTFGDCTSCCAHETQCGGQLTHC